MNIVLATKNKKKAEEIIKIIRDIDAPIRTVLTLDNFPECPDVKEDGTTFEENAVKKAEFVSAYAGLPALADDSGLEVDALNGAPGVYSARYAGDSADDTANLVKLLADMKEISYEKRSARFTCCIALAYKGTIRTFSGYVKGRIGTEPIGKHGFGYDPVFYPEGHDITFAEMNDQEKNALSHRGSALREFKKYLSQKKGMWMKTSASSDKK
jgi:XTP/dITP diphosphohydrolase